MAERIITIDDYAFDKGKVGTQDERIASHNRQGSIMMSMPDWYNGSFSNEALKSTQRDERESILVLGDRFFYKPEGLKARIVSHFGSTVIRPTSVVVEVPVLERELLERVLSKVKGREYMQALCGIRDKPNKMIARFEELSGVGNEAISVWTPEHQSRKDYPEMAAGLDYCRGFHVGGDYYLNSGRSRGVQYLPAEQVAPEKTKLSYSSRDVKVALKIAEGVKQGNLPASMLEKTIFLLSKL